MRTINHTKRFCAFILHPSITTFHRENASRSCHTLSQVTHQPASLVAELLEVLGLVAELLDVLGLIAELLEVLGLVAELLEVLGLVAA